MSTEAVGIEVAGAPELPGLRFRRYEGEADLPALQRVLEAQVRADGEPEESVSLEALLALFADPLGWEPARDVLIAEQDGQIVAWSRIQYQWFETEDAFRSRGYVLPAARGRGLGRAMLRRNEADLLRLAAEVPTRGKPRWLQGWVTERMPAAAAVFEAAGYETFHFYFEMERPVELPLPEEAAERSGSAAAVLARPTAGDMRAMVGLLADAFRGHWGHYQMSEADIESETRRMLDDPSTELDLCRVSRDGERIVGVLRATYDAATRSGAIEELGTHPGHRGRGIGSALLASALDGLRDRGAELVRLGVDAEDRFGALGLYERFGFRVAKRGIGYRKAIPLPGRDAA
ncbi:MAG TPA: GNAT family N-acetyltransferase [Candidatus Limnocylindrales bacterium]